MALFDIFRKTSPPISAKSGPSFGTELRTGGSSDTGVRVTDESALNYLTVLACIRVISESIGMLPINVYRREGERSIIDPKSAIYPVIAVTPNSFQTATEFWEMVVAHLAWRGNFYAFKVTGGDGRVLELIPISPDNVEVEQKKDFSLEYKVTMEGGSAETHQSDKIFHVKRLSLDGITGMNPITYARESLGLGIATQRHGAKLFSNGARPGGILSTEQVLKDDSYNRIRDSWDDNYSGLENAHKVAILEAGLKFQSVGMSAEDSQFLETRKYQRSEICGLFRVPPHMIGDLERSTFSNIEHQSLQFVTQTLGPYLSSIESRILSDLLTEKERGKYVARFDVTELLRGDMTGRSSYYRELVNLGAMSPNEIRSREGMNPREGGDIYFTPLNMSVNGKTPDEEPTPEPQPNEDQETTETV